MDKKTKEKILSLINPIWHDTDESGLIGIHDGILLAQSVLKERPEHLLASQYITTYAQYSQLGLDQLTQETINQLLYGSISEEREYCVDFEYIHPRFDKTVYDHVIVTKAKDANEAEWTVRGYIANQFNWYPSPIPITFHLVTTTMPRYAVKMIPSLTELQKAEKEIEARNERHR